MAQGDTITEMIQDLYASREQIIDSIQNKGVEIDYNTKYEELPLLIDTIDMEESARTLWGLDRTQTTSISIPNGTTKIGDNAFYGCKKLSRLTIASSVSAIGDNAFYACPSSCNVRFQNTMEQVLSIPNAPWGISVNTILHCSNGDLYVKTTTSITMALPTMERVVDLTTTQDNVITSEGDFWVLGTGLTWDTTKEDEGFFVSTDHSSEERCNGIESTQNPTCAALHNPLLFDQAGDTITLVFRFRHGSTLKQIDFTELLVTAV